MDGQKDELDAIVHVCVYVFMCQVCLFYLV